MSMWFLNNPFQAYDFSEVYNLKRHPKRQDNTYTLQKKTTKHIHMGSNMTFYIVVIIIFKKKHIWYM